MKKTVREWMLSDCKHPASQIDCEIDAVSGESYYWCDACGMEIDGNVYDAKYTQEIEESERRRVVESQSQQVSDIE